MIRMVELTWWGLGLIILATIVVYTFVFLLALKSVRKGQKGRFLFNLPIAPFSIKSRVYTISKQLGVQEEDIKYIGDNVYKVNDNKYTVEGFFGVVVYLLDANGSPLGAVKSDVVQYNLANLRHESGETKDSKL